MSQDDTMKKLTQIGAARIFQKQDYICHEGQPGTVMYVILKGSVGVYVSSAAEKQVEVCRLGVNDFFGEMSILDDQPRSASCVALEHVVCAEISKDKLQQFITVCPEIAMRVLESLSLRIRRLNNDLYKTSSSVSPQSAAVFAIPEEYSGSHKLSEPVCNNTYLNPVSGACPICGREVSVTIVKKLSMTLSDPRKDGRTFYKECDPLWHSVWSCPHCRYSNFYSRFFAISEEEKETIRRTLEEQQVPVIEKRPDLESPFDQLFIHYLQTIHINRNAAGSLLIGRLWLNLYWLFDDARDQVMKKFCAERAAAALAAALESDEIPDKESRLMIQLSLTDMYFAIGDKASAAAACNAILACKDHLLIRKLAYDLKTQYKL